jgi:hypothetical protein
VESISTPSNFWLSSTPTSEDEARTVRFFCLIEHRAVRQGTVSDGSDLNIIREDSMLSRSKFSFIFFPAFQQEMDSIIACFAESRFSLRAAQITPEFGKKAAGWLLLARPTGLIPGLEVKR